MWTGEEKGQWFIPPFIRVFTLKAQSIVSYLYDRCGIGFYLGYIFFFTFSLRRD